MNKKEFNKFFKYYSKNIDNADKQQFWKLCDEIIIEIIKANIKKDFKKQIILDAGGGTGRWTIKLSKIYPRSRFIIYDLSENMLLEAAKNIEKAGLKDKAIIIKGDLTNIKKIENNSVDYIISIYNPISFISKKEKAVKEMFRILKKKGKIVIMGQGYFNAIASKINNFLATPKEINKIEKRYAVKWNNYAPELNLFSKESMEKILKGAGFRIIKNYGVPVFIQPGSEDFDPKNTKKSRVSKALENRSFFNTIFILEMKYNSYQFLINRGMNIISVAIK